MAFASEADGDFKLPLRPWLKKQIDSRMYKGLEWEPTLDGSQQFRLPWVKKNLPDWNDYYKIFRAWAEHRGRGYSSTQDDSKLKSNFRCALNKSVDFEEVPAKSTLNQQTGNYKVYRLLTPNEVRQRRAKESKILTKNEPGSFNSLQNNFDSDTLKTIEKKDFFEEIAAMEETSDFSQSIQTLNGASTLYEANSPANFAHPNEITYANLEVVPPDGEEFTSYLAISPAENTQHPNDCQPVSNEDSQMEVELPASLSPPETVGIIMKQLEESGISKEDLNKCELIVKYNGEEVVRETLLDMDKGYRIHYGDSNEQLRLMEMHCRTDEELSDYRCKAIHLPQDQRNSKIIRQILEKTELGLVIKYDPTTLQLHAKRLSQSQIFFYDPHNHNDNLEPKKLERQENVTLFSHVKFTCDMIDRYAQGKAQSDTDIILSLGIKPRSIGDMKLMRGVKIIIIPYVLKFLQENQTSDSAIVSLYFSGAVSFENFLRQMNGKR